MSTLSRQLAAPLVFDEAVQGHAYDDLLLLALYRADNHFKCHVQRLSPY